jgi:hypothetical protein
MKTLEAVAIKNTVCKIWHCVVWYKVMQIFKKPTTSILRLEQWQSCKPVLTYTGTFLPIYTSSHPNRQLSLLHISLKITKHNNMHCIMTQEQAMSHSTVRSSNMFDSSWCDTLQTHSEKAVCTMNSIWLSFDTAKSALSRMFAMLKLEYIYLKFTKFCSLYKPQIHPYLYFIPTQLEQCDDLDLYSVGTYFKSWEGCQTSWCPSKFSSISSCKCKYGKWTMPQHLPTKAFQFINYSTVHCYILWDS